MPTRASLRFPAALTLSLMAGAAGPSLAQSEPGRGPQPSHETVGRDWLETRWARADLARLAGAARAALAEQGSAAAGQGLASLTAGLVPASSLTDPWGLPYRLVDGGRARVLSSGPDRLLGTADDLSHPLEGGAPAAAPEGGTSAQIAHRLQSVAIDDPMARPSSEARTTHERMTALASALEAFRSQRGHYPVGLDATGLAEALVPEQLSTAAFEPSDGWGRPWRYRSNDVGSSYTLVSGGSDGAFESLVPLRSGPVSGDERDRVLVDGSFARWPAGLPARRAALGRAAAVPAPPPRAATPAPRRQPAPSPPPRRVESRVEPGAAAATRDRLETIAEALRRFRAREGRYPELDDAVRLVRVLGLAMPGLDSWGRELGYLSLGSGSRCVLASRGADGRFQRDLEEYLRGARESGDDLVYVNGRPAS